MEISWFPNGHSNAIWMNLFMWTKLTLIILFSALPSLARALTCTDGSIRVRQSGDLAYSNSSYCYNDTKTFLISKNCFNRRCSIHQLDFSKLTKKILFSPIGSPGFRICRALNGEPEIMQFQVSAKWWDLDRCIFAKDRAFIDTSSLTRLFIKYLNNQSE